MLPQQGLWHFNYKLRGEYSFKHGGFVFCMSTSGRSKTIDGFRGIAVLFVVFSHAVTFRFGTADYLFANNIKRLADPLAEIGVQIFFVISGYIITTLLLREETSRGKIGVSAFYARRTLRIIPPLVFYMLGLLLARQTGWITFPTEIIGNAMLFTCNTGLTDCSWWVAHTWSLAVEEQYYLIWPMLFGVLRGKWRTGFLTLTLVILLSAYTMFPHAWHSNFISFACIIGGALFATNESAQLKVKSHTYLWLWIIVSGLLVIGPLFSALFRPLQFFMPFLIIYFIFAGREITIVGSVLRSRFLQFIGSISYSLYLWQQLFLGDPQLYNGQPLPLLGLPVAVALSVLLIERPSIRLGQILSKRLLHQPSAKTSEVSMSIKA